MLSDRAFSKDVVELLLDFSDKLEKTVVAVKRVAPDEEFLAYRNAVGIVLADVLTEFLNPIFRRHPDLKPKGFE